MWNRLKAAAAAASNVVQSLDDMLNQPRTNPLEEFEHYWKCVQVEHNEIVEQQALAHAQEGTNGEEEEEQVGSELKNVASGGAAVERRRQSANDTSVLKNSGIKEHLEQLVTLLRDEEADDERTTSSSVGTVRPCLSYMLEHHVVEILCAMALADQPRGMMALVLQVIKLMLHHVDQPLIPHVSVHRPINHLIHVCMEAKHVHNSTSTMTNGGHKASYRMQTSLIGLLAEMWKKIEVRNFSLLYPILFILLTDI
jgi:hypothetical protein